MRPAELRGGLAVVTGAASGIGEGIAWHAASLGMSVAVLDRDAEAAVAVAERIGRTGGTAVAYECDVTDLSSLQAAASAAVDTFGPVRLLVNNAGVDSPGRLWEVEESDWDRVMAVNVGAIFRGIRAFVPDMITADVRSAIVITSSIGAVTTPAGGVTYCASKHAALAVTEGLLVELDQLAAPISVHAFLPSPVDTAIYRHASASGETGQARRDELLALLRERGISPAAAAAILFEGIARDQFWIFTDVSRAHELFDKRADLLASRGRPSYAAAATDPR